MKKLCLMSLFLVLIVFLVFGQTEDREEIDYLLFLPNSGSQFTDEIQAMTQLDNLARYLSDRSIAPGRIYVYGYAAFAVNDIDPVDLSRDRALFVIRELQRRGVPRNLFSDPVGLGAVDLWGGNTDEDDRIPNRRVRVVLDGSIVTPETLKDSFPEIIISAVEIPGIADEELFGFIDIEEETEKAGARFPWLLLFLQLLLAAITAFIFIWCKRRKIQAIKEEASAKRGLEKPVAAGDKPVRPEPAVPAPAKAEPAAPSPVKPAPAKSEPAAAAVITTRTVNLDEEIRGRAHALYLERGCLDGYAAADWYEALIDVCARYESAGYSTYFEDGYWWASLQEAKPA